MGLTPLYLRIRGKARIARRRLLAECGFKLVDIVGHLFIIKLTENSFTVKEFVDPMIKRLDFEKPFNIFIADRIECNHSESQFKRCSLVCYTNSSKTVDGLYIERVGLNTRISAPL